MTNRKVLLTLSICTLLLMYSCGGEQSTSVPKPRGYMRVKFPEKEYRQYTNEFCHYSFEIPKYCNVIPFSKKDAKKCWVNLEYPVFKATLHLSFHNLNNNFRVFQEESRDLAYKHTSKAAYINETVYSNPKSRVSGLLYEIGGNAASNCQFYLSDSTHSFIRGALYFYSKPNIDSIAPMLEYLKKDITHLMETTKWN